MAILRDIPISLSPEFVLEAQNPRRRRGPRRPVGMADVVQHAIDLAQPLCTPAAVYDEFDVQGIDGPSVQVSSNGESIARALQIGPHADLLAPARRLLVAVYSIGPALEAQVHQLNRAGEMLMAYWLDTVGVLALGAVGQTVRCVAEEKAAERNWGVGAALSPGSLVGWSVRGQRELCALLPLADIGVELNRQCVLVPHKSASVVIGLGPGYDSHQVGSVCRFCSLADTCWRRR